MGRHNPKKGHEMRLTRMISVFLFGIASYVCLPLILIMIGADVGMRYFFNAPIIWAQEGAALCLFAAIAFSLPESWLRDVHIKADFLTVILKPWIAAFLYRISWIILIIVSLIIAYQCWADLELIILFNERTIDLDLPLSWFRIGLGFAACVTAIVGVFKLVARHSHYDTAGAPL